MNVRIDSDAKTAHKYYAFSILFASRRSIHIQPNVHRAHFPALPSAPLNDAINKHIAINFLQYNIVIMSN